MNRSSITGKIWHSKIIRIEIISLEKDGKFIMSRKKPSIASLNKL
jgi:hypothetical protein